MERLQFGPSEVHAINANLIYVRVSGFGHSVSSGETKNKAGHDINFLAASGLLSKFRRNDKIGPPIVPANALSYYSGGFFAFV